MGEVAISLDLRMSWLWEAQPGDLAFVETKRFLVDALFCVALATSELVDPADRG